MSVRLIPATFRRYQASWLVPDLLAGLTLVAIAVPEQIATSRLAGMPAIAGLYAFIAGSLAFALLGRHPQMSVGADSTIAPILAAGVAGVAVVGTGRYVHSMLFLALMVGILVIAVGLLRLGWVADFLSTPVVTGVLAGIAIQIVVHQLPAVLGLAGGGTTTVGRLREVADQISHANGWSVGIAIVVLGLVLLAERIDRRIPGALIGLVASTACVAALDLKSRGVPVLGTIHRGLPAFAVPSASWSVVGHLVAPALTVAFVCVVQTAATVRASGEDTETPQDFNADLMAIGAGSILAGFSGSFAVNASPPRTQVVRTSGGRSQLTSLVAAAVVLGIVLVATGLLKDLPLATLGAVLVFIATRMFHVRDLALVLRFDRLEFTFALVAMLVVALVGIEQGVLAAMLLSLAERTQRAARPRDAVLGREPGTDHWIPCDVRRDAETVPGMIVYLIYAPLWYGNAKYVERRLHDLISSATAPVHALVLDMGGISDIDYTGAQMLRDLATDLAQRGVKLNIARSSQLVRHDLKHSGLLAVIGPDHLFDSVEEAVDALGGRT